MKKYIVCCILFLVLAMPCLARDFIVEFVEESYKETQSPFSYLPIVYHSIQVTSHAGPKILILNGEDYHQRNWLRQYVAKGRAFVVKVPDDKADLFITSSAFEINVTDIHPLNLDKYRKSKMENQTDPNRYALEKNIYGSGPSGASDKKAMQQQTVDEIRKDQDALKQKAKADQEAAKKEALENKQLEQQARKLKLEKEKEQAQKLAAAQREVLEKERLEQAKLAAQLAQERAAREEQRKLELELRWQQLKQRLLEDENIRQLDRADRERELNRRWQELKLRMDVQ